METEEGTENKDCKVDSEREEGIDKKTSETLQNNSRQIFSSHTPKKEIASSFCIGDFTENSLLYTGEEVVHIPRISYESFQNDENKEAKAMKGMLELFEQLNFKLDAMARWRSAEKSTITEARSFIELGRYDRAKRALSTHCNPDSCQADLLREVWNEEKLKMLNSVLKAKTAISKLELFVNNLLAIMDRKANENDRLREVIKSQHSEHLAQLESVVEENSNLKNGVVRLVQEYSHDPNSKLEDDLLLTLEISMKKSRDEVSVLSNKIAAQESEIKTLRSHESNLNLNQLKKRLESSFITRKKLEEQNLQFNEIIKKLSDENVKRRKDLETLNEEMKRIIHGSKRKDETITRQRVLIQLFQNKLGGSCVVPIEELRRRKERIVQQLSVERDFIKKDILRKEAEDCDRRLSDFIKLQEKQKR